MGYLGGQWDKDSHSKDISRANVASVGSAVKSTQNQRRHTKSLPETMRSEF